MLAALAAIILALGLAATTRAAAPIGHNGRVVISNEGDITIPAGERADVVVVVKGAAHVQGEVNTLVVVEGTADLTGARLETVVAVKSSVEVGDGTVVYGEFKQLD